jgi:hypothetical protein
VLGYRFRHPDLMAIRFDDSSQKAVKQMLSN